jgi:hypothetical protein
MRRRASAAVTGLRRRLSPGSSLPPSVPVYFNLLADAEFWPQTGRVGEQRLLLVQYWRQMQREIGKEDPEPAAPPAAAAVPIPLPAPPEPAAAVPAPAEETPVVQASVPSVPSRFPAFSDFDDDSDDKDDGTGHGADEPIVVTPVESARPAWVPASVLFAKRTEEGSAVVEPTAAGSVPIPEARSVPDDRSTVSLLLRDEPEPLVEAAEAPVPNLDVPPPVVEVPVEFRQADVPSLVRDEPLEEPPPIELAAELSAAPVLDEPLAEPPPAELDEPPPAELEELPDLSAAAAELAAEMSEAVALDEPLEVVAEVTPDLTGIALDMTDDAVDALMVEFADAELPEPDVAAMAAEVIADDAAGAIAELPADLLTEGLDDLAAQFVAESYAEAPAFVLQAPDMALDELRLAESFVEMSIEELSAGDLPDVELAAESLRAMAVEEALEIEMPALIAEVAEPADLEPIREAEEEAPALLSAAEQDATEFVQAIEDAGSEMPVPLVDAAPDPIGDTNPSEPEVDVLPSPTTPAAFAEPLTTEAPVDEPHDHEEAVLDVDLPVPSSASTFTAPLTARTSDEADEDESASGLEPSEALTGDTSFADWMSEGFDAPNAGDSPSERPRASHGGHQMPALEADPVWDDAMAEWTVAARDTRLRRAGVIPMPTSKPSLVSKPKVRSAIPALERFLRSAEARRRKVAAESVA